MLRTIFYFLESFLPPSLNYYLKVTLRRAKLISNNLYSSEIKFLNRLLDQALENHANLYFVDIGASDGILNSNTFNLVKKKWHGISIEGNNIKYKVLKRALKNSNVKSINKFVFSSNVCSVLRASFCKKKFDFLSLDIDSFEHSVLNQILMDFKPRLICVEINERFPPPIIFHIKESVDKALIKDAFYGLSILYAA